ncbi:MAG: hypothetical protein AB7Q17_04775 [Phycisphaerae bacterium]
MPATDERNEPLAPHAEPAPPEAPATVERSLEGTPSRVEVPHAPSPGDAAAASLVQAASPSRTEASPRSDADTSAPAGPSSSRPASDREARVHEVAPLPHAADEAPGAVDTIRPIVAEIRQRLATIAQREVTVQRREAALHERLSEIERRARVAVEADFEPFRTRIEARSTELDAQSVEIAARRARLEALESQVSEREAEIERRQREMDESAERLRQAAESARRARVTDEQQAAARLAALVQREKELDRRVQLARDEIVRKRTQVDDELATLQVRQAELDARRAEVEARSAEWDARFAELDSRAATLDGQQREIAAARRRLEEHQEQLRQSLGGVEQQRTALNERQHELERHWQTTRDQRAKLIRQIEEFHAQQRKHQQAEHEQAERRRQLDAREAQLRERSDALEAEARRLETAERELREQHAAVERLAAQAAEYEQDLHRQRDEVQAFRDQVESRDVETRQAALTIELERQNLVRDQSLLETARAEVALAGERTERELSDSREALRRRAVEIERAQRTWTASPTRWWLRAGLLATAAGAAVALFAYSRVTPLRQLAATLRFDTAASERGPEQARRVTAQHSAELLAPANAAALFDDPAAAAAWSADVSAGRVQAAVGDPPTDLVLRVRAASDDASAEARLRRAADGYVARVNAIEAADELPGVFVGLARRRDALETQIAAAERRKAELEAEKALLPDDSQRAPLELECAGLRAELAALGDQLGGAQRELSELLAGSAPRGVIDAAVYEAALAGDPVYSEDQKEFRATAKQYQTELAVAMVLLVDPLKALRESLANFGAVLAEQQRLQPPPAVAASLEELTTRSATLDTQLAELAGRWDTLRLAVERPLGESPGANLEDDVLRLVERQAAATDAARTAVSASAAFLEVMKTQLELLSGGEGAGTREVVVGALLRSEQTHLRDRSAAVADAAGQVDAAQNVQVDGHERRLRGLRMRMQQRRDLVREAVQREADRQARGDYDGALARLREQVSSHQARRDEIVAGLTDRLDTLRELDGVAAQHERAAGSIALLDASIASLREQATQLDEALAEARRSGPRPDRATLVAVHGEFVSGQERVRDAVLAGFAAFATAWAVAFLIVLKNPFRRTSAALAFAALPSDAGAPQR